MYLLISFFRRSVKFRRRLYAPGCAGRVDGSGRIEEKEETEQGVDVGGDGGSGGFPGAPICFWEKRRGRYLKKIPIDKNLYIGIFS
jgi:hypothetical protein